jgi:hypothetical protein
MSSKCSSKDTGVNGDAVVTLLEDFFYFEDPLTERVEDWAEHVSKDLLETFDSKIDEHPLSHTVLHGEYKDLFEDILSEFLLERGHTPEDFYLAAAAQEEAIAGKRRNGDTFASVVMAASDFDSFCEMMNDVRQGRGVAFCPPLMSASEEEEDDDEERGINREEDRGSSRLEGKVTSATRKK